MTCLFTALALRATSPSLRDYTCTRLRRLRQSRLYQPSTLHYQLPPRAAQNLESRWSFFLPAAWKAAVLFRYLRQLDTARIILWCYAIWYAVVLVRYFDASPTLWLTSMGLSGIIGCALLLSTRAAIGRTPLNGWGIFRLFLMPFCVSSFSALVKGRGFLLIFSPQLRENLLALGLCGAFCGFVALLKRI